MSRQQILSMLDRPSFTCSLLTCLLLCLPAVLVISLLNLFDMNSGRSNYFDDWKKWFDLAEWPQNNERNGREKKIKQEKAAVITEEGENKTGKLVPSLAARHIGPGRRGSVLPGKSKRRSFNARAGPRDPFRRSSSRTGESRRLSFRLRLLMWEHQPRCERHRLWRVWAVDHQPPQVWRLVFSVLGKSDSSKVESSPR